MFLYKYFKLKTVYSISNDKGPKTLFRLLSEKEKYNRFNFDKYILRGKDHRMLAG